MIFRVKTAIVSPKAIDNKPIHNKNILKTKIKSYGDETPDFPDKEMPKLGSNYICLVMILIGFVL